ncbi:MAG TPA: hypothetical protein VHR15_12880 [Ktedonobacterales bacterium]|jgi:multisubunit Na+/H+ antiporter MnhB subunit|nr:hypothetical protein [Ktedonobacterales bacterium]
MFPPKSPGDLWSPSRFTRRIPDFSPEREDEIAALFTRSHMSSAARSSIGPSLNFTELVMARVREEAQAQHELASVSPLVTPISFDLTFEHVREMARGVARSTWLLAGSLFIATWLALLTSPLLGFGLMTTGAAAMILHMGALRYALFAIARVLSDPDTILALMTVPILLFVALIALIQRSFPRLALDLF